MERGPLPPHERTWRHPSELAAEERAALRARAAAPSTRVFALTTGTLGLLAVGVLILTVTPRRQESPIAVSATTTPSTSSAAAASTEGSTAGPAAGSAAGSTEGSAIEAASALAPGFGPRRIAASGRDRIGAGVPTSAALATPIGDGRLAVVTRAALGTGHGVDVEVVLPSGQAASGDVVHAVDDAVVVEIDGGPNEPGHTIADHQPSADEIVTVLASPPITVAFADVDELVVDEGTAVLDADGDLIGVCSKALRGGEVLFIEVSSELADATTAGR